MKRCMWWCTIIGATLLLTLVLSGRSNEPVPVGTTVLPLSMDTGTGPTLLRAAPRQRTLLVLYSPRCIHCRRQLEMLTGRADSLGAVRLVFVANRQEMAADSTWREWVRSYQQPNVNFGIIDIATDRILRGDAMLPELLFLDGNGVVRERLNGETKWEKILSVLGKI